MRHELSDYEWTAIKPMLPNKPRGVRRVNDRRVLNGIFWVLRSGAPWRDLPENYGPRTTYYNRFVRWRRAGVWDQIMDALAAGHDTAVQMIDTSVVRVHQHGACIADNNQQDMGRSRGGLTSAMRKNNPTANHFGFSEIKVKPKDQKYSAFAVGQITATNSPVHPDKRGVSRSSRTRGWMRWTRKSRLTSVADADGEVVWS
jgi:transposase